MRDGGFEGEGGMMLQKTTLSKLTKDLLKFLKKNYKKRFDNLTPLLQAPQSIAF